MTMENTNGHSSDDMPEESGEFEFPQAEENEGPQMSHSTGGNPGLKDIFVGQDNKGARRDPIDRMAVSSTHIEEYLPLTRLTRQELARDTRIIASLNNVNLGHSDPMHVMWFKWIGSIAVNGEGRKEMVTMVTADRNFQRQQQANRFRGMGDRARGNPSNLDVTE